MSISYWIAFSFLVTHATRWIPQGCLFCYPRIAGPSLTRFAGAPLSTLLRRTRVWGTSARLITRRPRRRTIFTIPTAVCTAAHRALAGLEALAADLTTGIRWKGS